MNVSSWSIKNPIPTILLFVMLTLAGLWAFKAMKIQQFPDIDLPTVTVTATLPGAAPAQMETEVARKIENQVATLQLVKHVYTRIQDGMVNVTVEFRHGGNRVGARRTEEVIEPGLVRDRRGPARRVFRHLAHSISHGGAAVGSRQSAVGSSAVGSRQSAFGVRRSAFGGSLSP